MAADLRVESSRKVPELPHVAGRRLGPV